MRDFAASYLILDKGILTGKLGAFAEWTRQKHLSGRDIIEFR